MVKSFGEPVESFGEPVNGDVLIKIVSRLLGIVSRLLGVDLLGGIGCIAVGILSINPSLKCERSRRFFQRRTT
jgi:hypothetical protein